MSILNFLENYENNKEYEIEDISVIISVRLLEGNEWLINRLASIRKWYQPCPNILIVDLGSEEKFTHIISDICKENDYSYRHVACDETFSLSKARNLGFTFSETDLLFFTDPDFFMERDAFARMLKWANGVNINFNKVRRLTIPAYHVSEDETNNFFQLENNRNKEKLLLRWSADAPYSEIGETFEFIAPYSNNFLCHRDFFDITGGYSLSFKGHGSEDFEYLVRLNLASNRMPIPSHLEKDMYKPFSQEFFSPMKYEGFRRLAEAETFSGELFGFKAFHLWHPRLFASKGWHKNNDRKRVILNKVFSRYIKDYNNLITEDYLPREQVALCINSDSRRVGYFLPLRLLGFKLDLLSDSNTQEINKVIGRIEDGVYSRIFIYNPYMYSHSPFLPIIKLARLLGIPVTIIERGALPNSFYYADDMSYADPDFLNLSIEKLKKEKYDLDRVSSLLSLLKSGDLTLEKNNSYKETHANLHTLRNNSQLKVFIPLQLTDDVAVTRFNDELIKYDDFISQLVKSINKYNDILFMIKPHPLSTKNLSRKLTDRKDNVHIFSNNENIHSLVEISDAVIVYNSGVGLLSVLHEKPTFHFGNAFYTAQGYFAKQISNFSEAFDLLNKNKQVTYKKNDVLQLLSWLVNYKYSFFEASDQITEHKHRKAHHYKRINVSVLNFKGERKILGGVENKYLFSTKSYTTSKLCLNNNNNDNYFKKQKRHSNLTTKQIKATRLFALLARPFMTKHQASKLNTHPDKFFKDAKNPITVRYGKFIGI